MDRIDTISFAMTAGPMCFSQMALYLSYIGQPLPIQILPQSDQSPVDLSVGDILWQITADCLQIAQWLQCTAYRKLPSLFRTVSSLAHLQFPLRPKWRFQYTPGPTLWHLLPPGDWKILTRFLLNTRT